MQTNPTNAAHVLERATADAPRRARAAQSLRNGKRRLDMALDEAFNDRTSDDGDDEFTPAPAEDKDWGPPPCSVPRPDYGGDSEEEDDTPAPEEHGGIDAALDGGVRVM